MRLLALLLLCAAPAGAGGIGVVGDSMTSGALFPQSVTHPAWPPLVVGYDLDNLAFPGASVEMWLPGGIHYDRVDLGSRSYDLLIVFLGTADLLLGGTAEEFGVGMAALAELRPEPVMIVLPPDFNPEAGPHPGLIEYRAAARTVCQTRQDAFCGPDLSVSMTSPHHYADLVHPSPAGALLIAQEVEAALAVPEPPAPMGVALGLVTLAWIGGRRDAK